MSTTMTRPDEAIEAVRLRWQSGRDRGWADDTFPVGEVGQLLDWIDHLEFRQRQQSAPAIERPRDLLEAIAACEAAERQRQHFRMFPDPFRSILGYVEALEGIARGPGAVPGATVAPTTEGEPKWGLWATSAVTIDGRAPEHQQGLFLADSEAEAIGKAYQSITAKTGGTPHIFATEVTPELWARRWEDPA